MHQALRERFRQALSGLRIRSDGLSLSDWTLIGVYAAFAFGVGYFNGLFEPGLPTLLQVLVLPPLLVLYPSVIEEVIFRGILLRRELSEARPVKRFCALTLSALLFVAWHPLNHYLIGLSDTSLFIKPEFLVIVTALGYLTGHLYLRTRSLWPAIAVHWLTTLIWNLFLGRPR
ncbi:MAG: CPBP family glutamic-type intramembrane protease [Acidimicrobiales bacterium]